MSCTTATSCTSCIADAFPPPGQEGSLGFKRRQYRTRPLVAGRALIGKAGERRTRFAQLSDFFVQQFDPLMGQRKHLGAVVAFLKREQFSNLVKREARRLRAKGL